MEKIQDENLFDLRLTPEGQLSLSNSAKTINWIFRLSIIATLFLFLNLLLFQFFYFKQKVALTGSQISILQTILYPIITFFDAVIFVWQFNVLMKFGSRCKKAIKESDEILFNQSFKLLHRYTKIAVFQLVLAMIAYLISIYIAFQFL